MALRWYVAVVESTDPRRIAHWWAEALGWHVVIDQDDECVLVPPWAGELIGRLEFHQVPPGMTFVRVDHAKSGKNRLHWDFAPHVDDDRAGEIARLIELGAVPVDIGQAPDSAATVLADPDGNEFCVLSARDS